MVGKKDDEIKNGGIPPFFYLMRISPYCIEFRYAIAFMAASHPVPTAVAICIFIPE